MKHGDTIQCFFDEQRGDWLMFVVGIPAFGDGPDGKPIDLFFGPVFAKQAPYAGPGSLKLTGWTTENPPEFTGGENPDLQTRIDK